MASWKWEGTLPLEPSDPDHYAAQAEFKPSQREWPTLKGIQVADGRAHVEMEAFGSAFKWFVMDLAGIESGGAPNGEDWVQISLGGNIPARMRNTEHIAKETRSIDPEYVSQKFPEWSDADYEAMAFFMIPFLSGIFSMEPIR